MIMDLKFRPTNNHLCGDVEINFSMQVFGYNGAELVLESSQIDLLSNGAVSVVDLPLGKYTIKLHVQSWSFEEYIDLSLTVLKYADAPVIEEKARSKLKPEFGEILLFSGYTKIV